MSDALANPTTGLGMSSFQVGMAGAVYVAGACLGALFSASSPTGSAARSSSC
ncbi:hypothetical protein [Nocardioides ungokensis]|uniref:hypothetical protein n=1 Tax=Nocardioides ungokensis TaxID=1643322 RepID=UPI001FEBCCBB|nr:hypothetical protein [Nocardioides ungokensis]